MHWGYGSKSLEQVNKCTGVSLEFIRVFTQLTGVYRLTPLRKLHGRLGMVVVRRRSADAQEDFHEKLIATYAALENADLDLSLFWLTTMEWNLAPPRRAKIIVTDANERTGLDYAQAANHDKDADWNAVGSSVEDTTAIGREMVNFCVGAILGRVVSRQPSPRCLLRNIMSF